MKTHTPGPWKVGHNSAGSPAIYGRSRKKPLAYLYRGDDETYDECPNVEANGALMAAAPALLEACEGLVQMLAPMPAKSRAALLGYDLAVMAIKKARGE